MRSSLLLALLTISLFLTSCGSHIPENNPCLVHTPKQADPSTWACLCADKKGEFSSEKPLAFCDGFIAWHPKDVERIFTYIRQLEANQRK